MISMSFLLSFSLYQESFGLVYGDLNVGNNTTSNTNLSKSANPSITNFSIYEDTDIGFKISYPSNWQLSTENSEYFTVANFKPLDTDIQVNVRIIPQGEYYSYSIHHYLL